MKSTVILAAVALLALSAPALAQSYGYSNGSDNYSYGRHRGAERDSRGLIEGRAGAAEAPPGDNADLTPNTNYNDILKHGN